MPETNQCGRCGAELTAFAIEGFCSACMLEGALSGQPPKPENQPAHHRRFGDYELLEEIARGGMGVVYKARQTSLDRIVAIKMILSGQFASPTEVQRFRAEAKAAAALQHPGIVAIHEVGEQEGQLFFSMDYVQGQNLAQAIQDRPFPPARAAQCVKAIAEAIQYAHERGILHRDLKPSNVLIDDQGQPHVTDFGVAKRLESKSESRSPKSEIDLTLTGQVLGSPNFMPPEQAAGKQRALSPASDVYSLGAILYHILTGRPPFLADSLPGTLRLLTEAEPVGPRLLEPSVPVDLETICLKCLDKEPGRRYATAQELSEELSRFLCDQPIQARPLNRAEKLWRWRRRHPAVAGLTALAGLLLIGIALVSVVSALRLNRANQDAREKLWESYLSQARAIRWSGRTGRRFDGLEAIRKAAEIRPSLELRNEAIACMALVDVRSAKNWDVPSADYGEAPPPFIDPTAKGYAALDRRGNLRICRVSDDRELFRFKIRQPPVNHLRFSIDGRFLAVSTGSNNEAFTVFDLRRGLVVLELTNIPYRAFDFGPDSLSLIVAPQANPPRLDWYDLRTRARSRSIPFTGSVVSLRVDPTGHKLAAMGQESGVVRILHAESGQTLQTLSHSNWVNALDWHPRRPLLVTGCADQNAYLWDLSQDPAQSIQFPHHSYVSEVSFHPQLEVFASTGWNDLMRVWDIPSRRELFSRVNPSYRLTRFSTDGHSLICSTFPRRIELCEFAGGREWQEIYPESTASRVIYQAGFIPGTDLLTICHDNGVTIWSGAEARPIATLPQGKTTAAVVHPSGNGLVTMVDNGLRFWPMRTSQSNGCPHYSFGPPELFSPTNFPFNFSMCVKNGAVFVCGDGKLFGLNGTQWEIKGKIPDDSAIFSVHLSQDLRMFATWKLNASQVEVWNTADASLLTTLQAPHAVRLLFSPDLRWLVTGSSDEYVFWDTKSWTARHRIARGANGGLHAQAAFTFDGRILALTGLPQTITLFDVANFRELATLEAPVPDHINSLAFDREGSRLIATTDTRLTHLWDLRLLRQQLAKLKLDWEAPPFPPATNSQSSGPIQTTVFKVPFEPRDSRCTSNLLDLSTYFNGSFLEDSGSEDNLASLPIGRQIFASTPFDVRGRLIVGLERRPKKIGGIVIGQHCHSLSFLHSGAFLLGMEKIVVGEYVIHYADGSTATAPLRNFDNIADWWMYPPQPHPLDTNTTVIAWRGENAKSHRMGNVIQLYKFRWDNPRPEVAVSTIDFKVTKEDCSLSLVAITAE